MAKPGRTFLIAFLLTFLAAAAALIYPLYVIRPFRHQEPGELKVALAVLQYRPYLVILCALAALVALVWYWNREKRWLRRTASALAAIAVVAVAFLSRVNVFEIMFKPFARPTFSSADQVKLDGDEKVIAVTLGQQARAYPIRNISYHHVINDVVDGIPIVATY